MERTRIDLMIDLECAGPAPNGAIISIGWCAFALDGLKNSTGLTTGPVSDMAFGRIDVIPESSVELGMELDADTVKWWLNQEPEVRRLWNAPGAVPLSQALIQLGYRYTDNCTLSRDRGYVWAYPATYDLTILDRAYTLSRISPVFHRKEFLCARSAMKALGYRRSDEVIPERWRAKHLPEIDAVRQVIQLQSAMNPDFAGMGHRVAMRLPHTITHDEVKFTPLKAGTGSAHGDFDAALEAEARRLLGR